MNTAQDLQKLLCSTFCHNISVNAVPCGFAVSSAFTDDFGDRIGFYIVSENEGYHLEDDGEYLPRLIAQGVDIEKGTRQQLLESVLQQYGAFWDTETYEIKTGFLRHEELANQMIHFLSALIRIRDLELLTRDLVRSTFKEDATEAIKKHFQSMADIEERKPLDEGLQYYPPDLVVRPHEGINGRTAAIFLVNSIVTFQEAELLKGEIEKEDRQDEFVIIALMEDTNKINTITMNRFQRSLNRGLPMPIYRGDEMAALNAIGREAGMESRSIN